MFLKKVFFLATLLIGLSLTSFAASAWTQPDLKLTPGSICTASDPNFDGYRYPSHVAHCRRSVSDDERLKVADAYHIPQADWSKYEFDHMIPLNSGGSDDATNIWPQPLAEAHQKDTVEQDVSNKLNAGTIDQAGAILEIRNWFKGI
jgi:hypothetical protein